MKKQIYYFKIGKLNSIYKLEETSTTSTFVEITNTQKIIYDSRINKKLLTEGVTDLNNKYENDIDVISEEEFNNILQNILKENKNG